jgi:hypothetical protein
MRSMALQKIVADGKSECARPDFDSVVIPAVLFTIPYIVCEGTEAEFLARYRFLFSFRNSSILLDPNP